MRKLATIRKINDIQPIENKDRIVLASIDGWTCVVNKDDFHVGDLCVYCEIDSIFPQLPQWKFLKKYNYKIKTQKFKVSENNYVYSQGLALPLSVLNGTNYEYNIGDDVTEELGITLAEDIVPKTNEPKHNNSFLLKYKWYRKLNEFIHSSDSGFPTQYVPKTDEERVQNCFYQLPQDEQWYATEKVDGMSATYVMVRKKFLFFSKYEFIVCSRNKRTYDENSAYHKIAQKYKIYDFLKSYIKKRNLRFASIQGEIVGPKIQKNKYNLTEDDFYVFHLYSENKIEELFFTIKLLKLYGIKFVPFIIECKLPETCDKVVEMSNGRSKLYDTPREGLVFRCASNQKISFKAVSPEFLIKHKL